MNLINPSSSFIGYSLTMSDDTAHRLVEIDMPFYEVNIHVYTFAAKYGVGGNVNGVIQPNDVVFFRNGNLKDFLFQNQTAGNNTVIYAYATVPTEFIKEKLK